MKENLEKISSGSDCLGQICPVCGLTISAEDQVVRCPRCHSVHHLECWKSKGGCGKTGCPQVAKAIKGEKPAGDGPPPPVPKWRIIAAVGAILALILVSVLWPKPDPAQGRTTIVVFGEAGVDLDLIMTELVNEFNEDSEEIYIDLQLLPPGSMDLKLVVLVAAGQAPDIIALSADRFRQYLEMEYLLELETDEQQNAVYGIQHPAQLSQLTIWKETAEPQRALAVLEYLLENIPPADLEMLRRIQTESDSLFPL